MAKCAYHPDVETSVSCSNCDKPICPKDMVYTPVGIKCPECARPVGRMRARGKPRDYAMAVLVAVAGAIVGGLLLGEVLSVLPFGTIILTAGYGYFMGEASSAAARRNGGLAYQFIVGGGTVAGAAIAGLVSGAIFEMFFIIGVVIATVLAVAGMRG